MADYKDYIVRYDIQANVGTAVTELTAFIEKASQMSAPLEKLSTAIKNVAGAAKILSENSNIIFKPQIDLETFKNQLREMVVLTKEAAREMQGAIFSAASNKPIPNTRGKTVSSVVSTTGAKAFKLANTTSELEKQLKETKALKAQQSKIINSIKKELNDTAQANRLTTDAKLQKKRDFENARILKDAYAGQIKQIENALALQKEVDRKSAALNKTSQKPVVTKSTPLPQAAPLTNVDSKTIKDWTKTFGKSKSKTLTLAINATARGPKGALTVIKEVETSLTRLQNAGQFTITPIINNNAFLTAEERLTNLARLSTAITNPFTEKKSKKTNANTSSALSKEDKDKLRAAQKQVKNWNEKIKAVQSRLTKNQAIPEDERTRGVKSQITKDQKALASYQANKANQEKIVSNIKNQAATASKKASKNIKPLGIDIIGNLTKVNPPVNTPIIPVNGEVHKLIGKIKSALPINVKISSKQVNQALKAIQPPSLNVKVNVLTNGIQEQLNQIGGTLTPVGKGKKGRTAGTLSATNSGITSPNIPGTSTTSISTTTPVGKVTMSQAVTRAPMIPYPATSLLEQQSRGQNIPPTSPTNQNTSSTANAAGKKPRVSSAPKTAQERYEALKQKASDKAVKERGDNRLRMRKIKEFRKFQSGMAAWRAQQQSLYDKIFGGRLPDDDPDWIAKQEKIRSRELGRMREDAKSAFSTLTPFEQKEAAELNKQQENARKVALQTKASSQRNKLIKKRNAIRNSIIPFVDNQGDLKTVFDNYKSFAKVNKAFGFTSFPGLSGSQLLNYLKAVSNQIQADGNAVPMRLANYITNLEDKIAKANTPSAPVTAPTGFVGSGKSRVFFGNAKPSANTAPTGYHWEKTNGLASRLSNTQITGYEEALIKQEQARQNLVKTLNSTQSAINMAKNPTSPYIAKLDDLHLKAIRHAGAATIKMGHAYNQIDQLNNQNSGLKSLLEKLEKDKASLTSLKSLKPKQLEALKNIQTQITNTQQQISANESLIDQNKAIVAQQQKINDNASKRAAAIDAKRLTEKSKIQNSLLAQPIAERREARKVYQDARQKARSFSTGYQLAPDTKKTVPNRAPSATQIRLHNQMLPFAQNKGQLNILTKYHRFFEVAAKKMGVTPTTGMAAHQMLNYLQGVGTMMQNHNVAVPWEMQSEMNRLQKQIAKQQASPSSVKPASRNEGWQAVPRGASGTKPISSADRFKRWAYPLTGQTSFGARTPMAVDMAKSMGVMFAIGGAMSAIGDSFGQAVEYQNMMKTTQAILQHGTDSYSHSSFENMEAVVREVGVKTKFSAPEVASAAKFLAMAGMDINAINNAIRPIADLALISDTDLGETADKMTNIMTTFGYNSARLQREPNKVREFGNIMATTATRSNTDVMMLAESAKYGGGVAYLYGKNEPNLFADTMALFGVMGNAGIQGSSAGTALRMMYQNIFKPNKNQKKMLERLSKLGVRTKKSDGSNRSMSDIITQIANLVPEKDLSDVVGTLFRITAQPGASASIMAATQANFGNLANLAKEDGSDLESAAHGVEAMTNAMSSKKGLSDLASLMMANRNSVNSDILGSIAEEKQNTVQGLWAQVTSTFTEGIVKAFEQKNGGFENMLKALRDYMAKPETVRMLQNLLDMIVQIGKVMAWFVKIWANLYNLAPGLIKFWVVVQMGLTQIGSLIAPFVGLSSVLNRLNSAMALLSGTSASATRNVSRAAISTATGSAASTAAVAGSPYIVGTGRFGTKKVVRGAAAVRAHNKIRSIENAALTAASIAALRPAPASMAKPKNFGSSRMMLGLTSSQVIAEKAAVQAHYAEVRKRANRIYGWRSIGGSFKSALHATPTALSLAPFFTNIKSMFFGLMRMLAKGIGLLVNPISIAVYALSTLGYGVYKFGQKMSGTTDAQQEVQMRAKRISNQTVAEMNRSAQWHRELIDQNGVIRRQAFQSKNADKIASLDKSRDEAKRKYGVLFEDISKNASGQSNTEIAKKWQQAVSNNTNYKLAFGAEFNELAGEGFTNWAKNQNAPKRSFGFFTQNDAMTNVANGYRRHEEVAKALQNKMVKGALITEGADDERVRAAVQEIVTLRKKYLNKEINPKTKKIFTESEYKTEAQNVRDKVVALFPTTFSSDTLTPERYRQTYDRSVYDYYQKGALNLIDAYIKGEVGTLTGMLDSQANMKKKVKVFSEEWYDAIAHTVGQYRVFDDFVSQDGKQRAQIELSINMLPKGEIDFSHIKNQIIEKIGKFQESIRQYANIMATVYQMMVDNGLMTAQQAQEKLKTDFRHFHITEQSARDYYRGHVANNKYNQFYQAGILEDEFVKFATDTSNNGFGQEIVLPNGKKINSAITRRVMRDSEATDSGSLIHETKTPVQSAKKAKETAKNASPKVKVEVPEQPSGVTADNTGGVSGLSTGGQMAYASAYEFKTTKPTQVVFNINNLASFDRTTIASSAEERDMVAMLEEKITGTMQQLFVEAANQFTGSLNA